MNAHEAADLIRSLAPVGGVYPVRDWPPSRRRWAVAQLAIHFAQDEERTGLTPYVPRWLRAEMQSEPEALKGGEIAGAPGLYFDSFAHRWRRAQAPDESGVHLDPETRRARHVPNAERADLPGWLREQNQHEDAGHAKLAERMNGVLEHFERGNLEFKDPRTADRHAVVIPDASEPGRWRFSQYDTRGFGGHRTFDSPHEAAGAAAAEGYTEPAPGSLDRMAATDAWAEGTRHARIGQLSNELGFTGKYDARRALDDHYAKHGFGQEAHDRIMQPHVLEALRRGEVPEALKAIGESLKALYGHAHAEPPPPAHDAKTPEVRPLRRRQRREHPFAGTIEIPGLPKIHVETSKGEWRRGTDKDGKDWAVKMPCHYGEFEGSEGADGDPLDVFVGGNTHAAYVYVIHLKHPGTQEYDEDKVFVGFDAKGSVVRTFAAAYNRPGFKGGMRRLTFAQLAEWLSERRNRGAKIHVGEVLKGGPIANAPGLHLDLASHRWVKDDVPQGHLFHTTSHATMPQIAQHGLQPRADAGVFGHGGYAEHSAGKVFLSNHFRAAREWHDKVADQLDHHHGDGPLTKRVPVMLRAAKRRTAVDPVGNEDVEGSRFTKQAIPPEDLEYWHPAHKSWRPVKTWGDDTAPEHGVKESYEQDGATLHNLHEARDFGGYKPDTTEQANAAPSAETTAHRASIAQGRADAEEKAQAAAQARAQQAEEERARLAAEHQRKQAEAAAADAAWHQDPVKRRDTLRKIMAGEMPKYIILPKMGNHPAGRVPEDWQRKLKVDEHGAPHPGTGAILGDDEAHKSVAESVPAALRWED